MLKIANYGGKQGRIKRKDLRYDRVSQLVTNIWYSR
jgi:hypothetical protein